MTPVVATSAAALPLTVPNNPLAIVATLAGPPPQMPGQRQRQLDEKAPRPGGVQETAEQQEHDEDSGPQPHDGAEDTVGRQVHLADNVRERVGPTVQQARKPVGEDRIEQGGDENNRQHRTSDATRSLEQDGDREDPESELEGLDHWRSELELDDLRCRGEVEAAGAAGEHEGVVVPGNGSLEGASGGGRTFAIGAPALHRQGQNDDQTQRDGAVAFAQNEEVAGRERTDDI